MARNQTQGVDEILVPEDEVKEIEKCLPKAAFMGSNKLYLVKYQEFWYPGYPVFNNIVSFQKHFHARDTDFIIASLVKAGTTWLKTLLFAVVNRANHPINQSPILSHQPHDLVYRLEDGIYGNHALNYPRPSTLNHLPSPRIFNTHFPFVSLPQSIKTSECRILYISRNPLDTFVSQWHFYTKMAKKLLGDDFKPISFEDYFEDCIEGRIMYGPFFEHVVEYWKLSLERPDKVLFLKYEDLKDDPTLQLKRMAEFLGMPFSPMEESEGVIRDIIELCSINNLKELNANKNGEHHAGGVETEAFFRKGVVGDWTNYFTPTMVDRMNELMHGKLEGTGLTFKLLPDHQ